MTQRRPTHVVICDLTSTGCCRRDIAASAGSGAWPAHDHRCSVWASVTRLADYVAAATRSAGALELYACWDGDQAAEPAHRLEMTPGDIGGRAFWFNERTFAVIAPAT